VGETTVNAKISIGQLENGGFGLSGELSVNVPGVSTAGTRVRDKAHQVCLPTRTQPRNIEIKLKVTY
jgi:organic hydroperoxide reductase OsmC/OhrA